MPSALAKDGWLFIRVLATHLEHLAAENTELKEHALQQAEAIRELRDEMAVLKSQKGRPRMKPGRMDPETNTDRDDETGGKGRGKRRHSGQPAKTARLDIHEERRIVVDDVPEGSRFHGTSPTHRRASPPLPARMVGDAGRPGADGDLPAGAGRTVFRSGAACLLRYHHPCHVTQPKLHEPLRE